MPTAHPAASPVILKPEREELKLQISGMTCAGCAPSIQKALEDRADVTSASVSFSAGMATVEGRGL